MKDYTTDNIFPKTLHIYNTEGGMIWQIYHVQTLAEASLLAYNAERNSYKDQILVDFTNQEETWPDWRPESKHDKPNPYRDEPLPCRNKVLVLL